MKSRSVLPKREHFYVLHEKNRPVEVFDRSRWMSGNELFFRRKLLEESRVTVATRSRSASEMPCLDVKASDGNRRLSLALHERYLGRVITIQARPVQQEQHDVLPATGIERVLQGLEVRHVAFVQQDRLPFQTTARVLQRG